MEVRNVMGLVAVLALASCAVSGPVAPVPLAAPVLLAAPVAPVPLTHAYVDEVHTGGHEAEHGRGTQAINLFAGAVVDVNNRGGTTVGIDYEYRLSHKWGVGGFAESVTRVDRSFAAGALLYWHAVGKLVLVGGLGQEHHGGHWEGILRVGGFYEFPMESGWVISPAVFYDFSEATDLLILGVNFGYIF